MPLIFSTTEDHHPWNPDEAKRVTEAGGIISLRRINGYLGVSRSFGDFKFKKSKELEYDPINGLVSAIPDVKVISKQIGDIVLLGSDGVFEFNRNEEIMQIFYSECPIAQEYTDNYTLLSNFDIKTFLVKKYNKEPSDSTVMDFRYILERLINPKGKIYDPKDNQSQFYNILAARIIKQLYWTKDDLTVMIAVV